MVERCMHGPAASYKNPVYGIELWGLFGTH